MKLRANIKENTTILEVNRDQDREEIRKNTRVEIDINVGIPDRSLIKEQDRILRKFPKIK